MPDADARPAASPPASPRTVERDAAHPPPRREIPARLVALLGALTAFSPLAIDMYLPAFPQIQRDLAAPPGTLQLTLSLFLAGLAIGQFVVGPISDRAGRRRPLLAGCTAFAAAAALCALAPSVGWLMAARLLMGFAGAAGLVVSRAVVRDLCDEVRSAGVYSFMMMVTGVAPVVAPLLGGQLLAYWRWRAVFWVLAAIALACGLAVALTLAETLPADRRSRRPAVAVLRRSGEILADRRFLGYAAAIGFSAGALFAYISGSPTVLMGLYGVSPRAFSALFAGNAIGLFLAAQLNCRLLRRVGPHQILRAASRVGAAAGFLLMIEAWSGVGAFYPFYATLFVCVATLGLIFPNATAAAMAPFGREAGAASAVLGLLQYAVGAAAGAAVGLLHDGTAVPMAGSVAACEACAWLAVLGTAPGCSR
jgi:DHA1 family bicyclomycin/chloramphenicol resistance-like MFS transporter